MHPPLSIALAQLNPHLGNVRANLDRLADARAKAAQNGAAVIVTPEMYLAGYPCDDLVLRSDFMDEVAASIDELTALTKDGGPAIIVGAPYTEDGLIYNSVFVLDGGELIGRRDKVNLPNYGVFDDKRNFVAGAMPGPIMVRGLRLGLPICEDMWTPDVIECLAESGAQMIIALNASPFETGKTDQRLLHAVARAVEAGLPVIYVNMIGGQDELVYDGGSFAINIGGKLACHLPSFSESVTLIEAIDQLGDLHLTGQITPPDEGTEALYRGLMLGLRDYVEKNGFPGVSLGLSGGIDSALVAAIAADAIGPEKVRAVMMPSPYTSQDSLDDAADLATRYGIPLDTIIIGPAQIDKGPILVKGNPTRHSRYYGRRAQNFLDMLRKRYPKFLRVPQRRIASKGCCLCLALFLVDGKGVGEPGYSIRLHTCLFDHTKFSRSIPVEDLADAPHGVPSNRSFGREPLFSMRLLVGHFGIELKEV